MPHPRKAPPAETASRSRPVRWLPVAALALLAPTAAWVLLPAETTGSEAAVASADSSGSRPLPGFFGSRDGNAATPTVGTYSERASDAARGPTSATRQAIASNRADAWATGARASGAATDPVSTGENFSVAAGGGAADVATPAPADHAAGAATLFLTIVGNQTYSSWGQAGDRPPPVDGMTSAAGGNSPAAIDQGVDWSSSGSNGGSVFADASGEVENPLGEAPQTCPRTLPPGSNQATADALRNQYSCRYLSGCDAFTQQCTWFYQGTG